jgi:T4-like virus tail tube protein gp19|nr:MAG TPA: Baseplate wedge protein [Caudoviricetes sp.]
MANETPKDAVMANPDNHIPPANLLPNIDPRKGTNLNGIVLPDDAAYGSISNVLRGIQRNEQLDEIRRGESTIDGGVWRDTTTGSVIPRYVPPSQNNTVITDREAERDGVTTNEQRSARNQMNAIRGINGVNSNNSPYKSLASQLYFLNTVNDSGFLKPSRYIIEFEKPKALANAERNANNNSSSGANFNMDAKKVGVLCHTVSMPQKSIMSYEQKQRGTIYKAPYTVSFDPLMCMFYCDGDMEARRFFENWASLVINADSNVVAYYDDIIANIWVSILDNENNVRYRVRYKEVYPLSVSPLELSYTMQNTVLNCTVNFSYKYFEVEQ